MDILTYINRMNQIYGNGPAPAPRYNTQQYLQGGRVGYKDGTTIGRPETAGIGQVKNFLNNLKKGSTVNRTNLVQKFNVDPSSLTKILKEYEDKNFTFEKSPSALKGSIINKPTKAQAELSEFLFGKKWNELSGQERTNIVNQGYNKDTVTDYRRNKLNTQYNKITKDLGYNKPYSELGYEDQRRVRRGDPPGVKFAGAKRQKELVDKDLRLLAENSDIQEIFKKGVTGKKDLALVRDILGQNANAPMRLTQLASAFTGDRPVEGITPRFKEQAAKIIEDTPYSTYQRDLDELKIGKSVGEKSTASIKKDIRKIPDYNIGGKYNIDEPTGVTSSVKAGTKPYGIFGQIIDRDINAGDKYRFDRQKLTRELELQKAIASGDKKLINTQVKKFNQLVNDTETSLNKNRKPGQKKIKLFKVSLDGPEKTIERFNALPKSYQVSFKNNFKDKGYSFKVPADYKTIPEIRDIVQNPNKLKTLLKTAATKAPRILAIPAAVGLGIYSLSETGVEAAETDFTKSSGVTTGDFFLAGAAPLATKKGRGLYGKAAKAALKGASTVPGILALEAGLGPGIVASTGGTFGEAIASPFLLEGTIRDKRIYDELKKQGYSEDQIQVVKDSVMLRADTGNVGLESSMLPLQEIEHEGKTYTAGDPKLSNIASIYDEASEVIAKEDKARLKRADEFDYLQLAKGGRVSFKFGSMGRRGFLKLLAALGLSGAAAGTGLIKLGGKAVGKKAAVKTGVDIATGTQGMPSWFPALVNKIIKEGDDVTKTLGTVEREIVHTKKLPDGESATVYRNTDTGDIRVEYDSVHNMGEGTAPVQMEYKAGQVIDEGKMAGKKTDPEFSASEVEPVGRAQGQDDYVIEWDGDNIVGNVDDLISDTSKLKQFATNKKPTMKEIVTRKRKTDEVNAIHKNESDYIATKQGEGDAGDYDDYLPDIDDID